MYKNIRTPRLQARQIFLESSRARWCRTRPHQLDVHNRESPRQNGPRLSQTGRRIRPTSKSQNLCAELLVGVAPPAPAPEITTESIEPPAPEITTASTEPPAQTLESTARVRLRSAHCRGDPDSTEHAWGGRATAGKAPAVLRLGVLLLGTPQADRQKVQILAL
jgi:hypothetical protein